MKVQWSEEKERSFAALKSALSSWPVLRAPDFDRPFVLQCDASDRGMGAVLSQNDAEGNEHPVVCVSRKLTIREQAYSASEKRVCVPRMGNTETAMLSGWIPFRGPDRSLSFNMAA